MINMFFFCKKHIHSPADSTTNVRVRTNSRILENMKDGRRRGLGHLRVGRNQESVVGLDTIHSLHLGVHHAEIQTEQGEH